MKKTPLVVIYRIFGAAALSVVGGFLAFLAYLYVAFSGAVIGDVKVDISTDLLAKLDGSRLETVLARLQTRENLPDVPSDLPDPYNVLRLPSAEPPPGPQPLP